MAAEPTCIIHPFSYTSPPFSSETFQQEIPDCMYGVEESVSFGRFMSDNNLSWERWSSFNSNRNRYVEEAEKFSRPGSVAQKKAYFEAHFKRMAALKAAALLEQEAAAAAGTGADPGTGIETYTETTKVVNGESDSCCIDANDCGVNEQVQGYDSRNEGRENEGVYVERFVVHQNELYSDVVVGDEEELSGDKCVEVVKTAVDEKVVEREGSVVLKEENFKGRANKELSGNGIAQMDIPPLQKSNLKDEVSAPVVKRNPPLSSFMTPVDGIGKDAPPLFAPSPARSTASVYPGKENYATPMKNKPSADLDKKRTPLRASINREFNRILSPVIRKIGSSSKTSKDCSTPLKTPAKASVNGVPEPPPFTPDITKRGARSHHDSSPAERKPAGPRWHILSGGDFKSPRNNRNKISSPIIPTSFCLRGRERATRRKQKLEDKFNATTEKESQPSKFKEKAEAELNKFRQSFCFKVMSSPDHYTEAESQNKSESTHRESPKQSGRQLNTSTTQSRSSLPPRRPLVKAGNLKNMYQRNDNASSSSVKH